MREVFSLDTVSEPERLDYWSAVTRQVFWPFRMNIPLPSLAGASVTRSVSSVVELATVTAGAHTLAHTAADAASSPGDTLCLALQIAGESAVRQDKRACTLRTGEALFFDPHRPYSMSFEAMFTLAVFSFPRELLPEASRHVESITARVLSAGSDRPEGALSSVDSAPQSGSRATVVASALAYFSCLAATFDSDGMIADSFSGGALAIADTLASELLTHVDAVAERDSLLDKAIAYIDLHLSDPSLAPKDVAVACHVSVRQLYRLFADAERTIAATIRERRLARSRSLLTSLPATTPVQWVGARVGFASVEQFTRAFRAAYGLPPAAWRAAERSRVAR